MRNRQQLLAALVAEHFGTYTAEYQPARPRRPPEPADDPPNVVAARRSAIDIDTVDEQERNAA